MIREQLLKYVGDRVFVHTPSEKTGKAYKFACPFVDPYRVLELYDNGVRLELISKPSSQPIRVALNRVRLCPGEIEGSVEAENQIAEQIDSGNNDRDREDEYPAPELSNASKAVDDSRPPTNCDANDPGSKEIWSKRLCPRVRKRKDHCGR